MTHTKLIQIALILLAVGFAISLHSRVKRNGREWTKLVAIPKCAGDQNMEVIYPQPFNGTVAN